MTLSDLVTQVWTAYKGKGEKAPSSGTDKYTNLVNIANRKIAEWARDPNVTWDSLYDFRSNGTISAALTYNLDTDCIRPSDEVILQISATQTVELPIVKPHQRDYYLTSVQLFGNNPKQLRFTEINDAWIGADLVLPGYYLPSTLTAASDVIPVDIPEWLVYATAAELARNDPAKEDQVANLAGQAAEIYRQMVMASQNMSFIQNDYQLPGESWS